MRSASPACRCSDATLTINGGSFNLPIYAQGRLGEVGHLASYNSIYASSDRSRYALDGDIAVNITGGSFAGGEISAFQTSTGYTQVLRGNFDVTVRPLRRARWWTPRRSRRTPARTKRRR